MEAEGVLAIGDGGDVRPSARMRPGLGAMMPSSSLSSVDLPEPFAPSRASALAKGDVEVDAVQGSLATAVQIGDAAQAECAGCDIVG